LYLEKGAVAAGNKLIQPEDLGDLGHLGCAILPVLAEFEKPHPYPSHHATASCKPAVQLAEPTEQGELVADPASFMPVMCRCRSC